MSVCEIPPCLCLVVVGFGFGIGWYGSPFIFEWLAKMARAVKGKP